MALKSKVMFAVKQTMKMLLQNVILPCIYRFWLIRYRNKEPELIIFADAHHDELPYSMERIHEELEKRGYKLTDEIYNFAAMSQVRSALVSMRFMKLYAQAKYVFICDNFLPASSCKKSEKTMVIQLLHSCGLLKKMGYDTAEDIPAGYIGQVYRNYDLVTVSAPCCVEPLRNAMHLPQGIVKALGVSRTDNYFDNVWLTKCKTQFYKQYPELKGKKIILWAPTFRGNAGNPYQIGMEEINRLEQELGEEYYIIKKVHPHVDGKYHLSNCSIPTEELFPVIDLLISDYSSVVNEFMAFNKPYLLFAPDLEDYEKQRGFYVPYDSLSPYVVTDSDGLSSRVMEALLEQQSDWVAECCAFHLGSCDGNSTVRILDHIGL